MLRDQLSYRLVRLCIQMIALGGTIGVGLFMGSTEPFIRGRMLDVTASKQVFSDTYTLPYPTEFLSVAFASSNYCIGDYWELSLDGVKVCETIYTK